MESAAALVVAQFGDDKWNVRDVEHVIRESVIDVIPPAFMCEEGLEPFGDIGEF